MTLFQDYLTNIFVLAFLAAVFTFIISIKMYRIIIHTVTTRNLMEKPGNRKIHSAKTATHGGVGLFASFSLSILVFSLSIGLPQLDLIKLLALITGTLILLFLGIKDDLIAISPKTKFIGQLISCIIVLFFTDLRITSFDGLLGVWELPYAVSVLFTLFVYILIINAVNLVDGIDGLAAIIATISSVAFGIFFLLNENFLLALVSFILFGSLLGFLLFNLSDKRKLFMGDSGSLFLGFLLAYQGMSFLGLNQSADALNTISNAPVLFLAILSFPLLDTLRVFVIRIKEKRSPFSPDCNHIHHRLLHIGLTHIQATIFVAMSNIILIGLVLVIGELDINVQLFITVFVGLVLYLSPFLTIFTKDIALEVDKTKPNNVISMKQVLASERPRQQTKSSYTFPVENEVANIETTIVNGSLAEAGRAKVEKFQKKISANGFVVFKKIPER